MSLFVDEWRKECRKQIENIRPDLTKKQINEYLDSIIDSKLINPPCKLDNNYIHKTVDSDLLTIYDWVKNTKPIIAGYGVFFKNQTKTENPLTKMTSNFLGSRKTLKDKRDTFTPNSYEYNHYDMLQNGEKVCANAIYGAGGAKTSIFYNLYTAASTTGTAQSLISTTTFAFESFLANNVLFYNIDDILLFINNIVKEKKHFSLEGIRKIGIDKVVSRLVRTAKNPGEINLDILYRALINLSSEDLTRIYYKNNLYEFTKNCSTVLIKLQNIMIKTKSFRVPEKKKMDADLYRELNEVWEYYREFVLYNHPVYNRIYRLKKDMRKAVLVIDTDSNMIAIDPWIQMMFDNFIDSRVVNTKDELEYIATNIICFILTNLSNDVLQKYCKLSNVLKEYRFRINMKNEYLFSKLITTEVKKHYLSSIKLREGIEMKPEKLDIKGLSFMKTTMGEFVSKYFKDIVKKDIFDATVINIPTIIKKLDTLTILIKESLLRGERNFTKPMSVKDPHAYTNPFSEMGIRAVMGWNTVYPDAPISLPDKIFVVKVKMGKLKDIESLSRTHPDIYEKLVSEIYENSNKDISGNGLTSFAIPQIVKQIPEWLLPFIDTQKILEDNTKAFFPVLKALGLQIISTRSNQTFYSNIIRV